jgi:uroporphyrinogen decarboxylase
MRGDLLLRALHCENRERPPIWIMRQAGRFLPEYRRLREKHSLWELFHHPELICEVTKLPLDLLGVDAAILFSDILLIAEAFGLKVHFPEGRGPFIAPGLQSGRDVQALRPHEFGESARHIFKAIASLRRELTVPLIGFCGAPFTVASYLIDSEGRGDLHKTKEWLYNDPESFHLLLQKLTSASIDYLRLQIEAGVQAIQIFDSWANVLSYPHFLQCSAYYVGQIIAALKESAIPVIIFCRGSSSLPRELASLRPHAISFDWQKEVSDLRRDVPADIAIQGNIDPDLLKAPKSFIIETVHRLLSSMEDDPGFIVNLGHGVLPDTSVENVRCLVETVTTWQVAAASRG